MFMWIFLVSSLAGFGCLNVLTRRVWNSSCRRQMCAGWFSTRMVCYLESRGRVALFTHLVTRRPVRPFLRGIVIPADRFGARKGVTLVTQPIASFIVTPVSIFHWNTWDQLLAAPGNFQA